MVASNIINAFELGPLFLEFLILEIELHVCLPECLELILIVLALLAIEPLNLIYFLQEFIHKLTHFSLQLLLIYRIHDIDKLLTFWVLFFQIVSIEHIIDKF